MNSQSKQCPKCQGMRWVAPEYKPLEDFLCCECKGTGEVSSPDPTTAGSEHSAGPSRRRSLPALAEVREFVESRIEVAAELKGTFSGGKFENSAAVFLGIETALRGVLTFIDGVNREEPEGNP